MASAVIVVMLAAAAAAANPPLPPSPVSAQTETSRLLDVPYLSQTEDLCGGAAVAMVLRYWGERQVFPEDFAPLVDRSAAGIRTDVLAADVAGRGWQAFPFEGAVGLRGGDIRTHVDQGRPVVALIEVRPGRYHYVVVVAWTTEQVVVHDPAQGPFRVMSPAEFDQAWAPADRWALLILPPDERAPGPRVTDALILPSAAEPVASECGPLVQQMVDLARGGAPDRAETGLLAAVGLCPDDAAAWRELAGIRFLQSRWAEAGTLTERALTLAPDDREAWDLLGTSRFLDDQPDAALDAWNQIGRPTIDLLRVGGTPRTNAPVIATLVGLPPRALLTRDRLGRASRRLSELPSASFTRLSYRPVDGGLAEIDAVVVERPTVQSGLMTLAIAAARAAFRHEVGLDVAAPFKGGELWSAAWRWQEARPRVGFSLAVPARLHLPGVTTIDGLWERQSYSLSRATADSTGVTQQTERRRAALSVADWATDRIRWTTGFALDRWADASHVSIDAAIDIRLMSEHAAIGVDGAGWIPVASGRRFTRFGLTGGWRSATVNDTPSWLATGGLTTASAAAPHDLWPGAGTGYGRTPLLRAHPLLRHGVVTDSVFGQRLAHGTLEYRRPLIAAQGTAIQAALFADVARAWQPLERDSRSWHADVGGGIRIALPGSGGTTRVDIARGLRDRRWVLSAGWQTPWPWR